MPITYVIDDKLLRTTVSGAFDLNDILEHRRAQRRDPKYRPDLPSLVDCRRVTRLPSSEELRALADDPSTVMPGVPPTRCAVIAGSEAAYGVLRMYAVFAESSASPIILHVFRDRAAAERWARAG